jgi:phenylpropionate dioxygenase-like ring-hydroxylating dioxygenase large terminal subunit
MGAATESVLWDDWHVVAELTRLQCAGHFETLLLGVPVALDWDPDLSRVEARRTGPARIGRALGGPALGGPAPAGHAPGNAAGGGSTNDDARIAAVEIRYGFVWLCLGHPARPIVAFDECAEADRILGTAGSVGVAVSGLRAVENFLDLSHLAFVHAGYLGEEPHTEIAPYDVDPRPGGGIVATRCRVYQPKPSPVDAAGFEVDYVYAVLRPYIVVLFKANPVERTRKDMIALFVQPVTEESCVAHILTCYLPHEIHPPSVRRFQQFIFGQDRPILENQLPKRLPLAPRAEISVRADGASAAYRRWLDASGVRFGAIAAR